MVKAPPSGKDDWPETAKWAKRDKKSTVSRWDVENLSGRGSFQLSPSRPTAFRPETTLLHYIVAQRLRNFFQLRSVPLNSGLSLLSFSFFHPTPSRRRTRTYTEFHATRHRNPRAESFATVESTKVNAVSFEFLMVLNTVHHANDVNWEAICWNLSELNFIKTVSAEQAVSWPFSLMRKKLCTVVREEDTNYQELSCFLYFPFLFSSLCLSPIVITWL